jgi:hypothetical protein
MKARNARHAISARPRHVYGTRDWNWKLVIQSLLEVLADYLESGTPLAITRHGETLGFYIPAQKRSRRAELDAMRAAAKDLDQMILSWDASKNELMNEYTEIRRAAREKKRNAR